VDPSAAGSITDATLPDGANGEVKTSPNSNGSATASIASGANGVSVGYLVGDARSTVNMSINMTNIYPSPGHEQDSLPMTTQQLYQWYNGMKWTANVDFFGVATGVLTCAWTTSGVNVSGTVSNPNFQSAMDTIVSQYTDAFSQINGSAVPLSSLTSQARTSSWTNNGAAVPFSFAYAVGSALPVGGSVTVNTADVVSQSWINGFNANSTQNGPLTGIPLTSMLSSDIIKVLPSLPGFTDLTQTQTMADMAGALLIQQANNGQFDKGASQSMIQQVNSQLPSFNYTDSSGVSITFNSLDTASQNAVTKNTSPLLKTLMSGGWATQIAQSVEGTVQLTSALAPGAVTTLTPTGVMAAPVAQPDPAQSTLKLSADSMTVTSQGACATTTTSDPASLTATATIKDTTGAPMVGAEVLFAADDPLQVDQAKATTDAKGVATATLKIDPTAQVKATSVTVSASVSVAGTQTPVSDSPAKVTLAANADTAAASTLTVEATADPPVLADGKQTYTATATLMDECGKAQADTPVAFSVTGSAQISQAQATTSQSGVATVTITDKVAEDVKVTATAQGSQISDPVSVTFAAPPPAVPDLTKSVLTVTPDTQSAACGEDATFQATAVIKDDQGDPIPDATVAVQTDGSFSSTATTDSSGKITMDVPVTAADGTTPATIQALVSVNGANKDISGSPAKVTVTSTGACYTATFSVADQTAPVPADGKSAWTGTLTVASAKGDPVTGGADKASFSISSADGGTVTNVVSVSGVTDKKDGTYTVQFTSSLAGSYVVDASWNGVDAGSKTITFADASTSAPTSGNDPTATTTSTPGATPTVTSAPTQSPTPTVSSTPTQKPTPGATPPPVTSTDNPVVTPTTPSTATTTPAATHSSDPTPTATSTHDAESGAAISFDADQQEVGVPLTGTLTLTDASGQPIEDAVAAGYALTAPNGATVSDLTDNGDGTYGFTVKATAPGGYALSLTKPDGTSVAVSATGEPRAMFVVTPGIIADPIALVAGHASTVFVHVVDGLDAPYPGQEVTFSVDGSATLSSATAITDDQGLASITVQDWVGETVHVTATLTEGTAVSGPGSFDSVTQVQATTAPVAIEFAGSPPVDVADLQGTLTITGTQVLTREAPTATVVVTDAYGRPQAGVDVTFDVSGDGTLGAGLTTVTLTTNAQGVAQVDITPNSATCTQQSFEVAATAKFNQQNVPVTGSPTTVQIAPDAGLCSSLFSVAAAPTHTGPVYADGTNSWTLTFTAANADGSPHVDGIDTMLIEILDAKGIPSTDVYMEPVVNQGDGTYTARLISIVPGDYTVKATWDGADWATAAITFASGSGPAPTATDTSTVTPTDSPTAPDTSTATPTNEPTATDTSTVAPTDEPSATDTATVTPTDAPTAPDTSTATPTDTPTALDTSTATPTTEPSVTDTSTATSGATPTTSTTSPTNTTPSASPIYSVAAVVDGQSISSGPNVVSFTAMSAAGVPVPSVQADFSVTGWAVLSQPSCVTDDTGICKVDVSSSVAGPVIVHVSVDGVEVAGTNGQFASPVTVNFVEPQVIQGALTVDQSYVPVGAPVTATVALSDQNGPAQSIEVTFAVTGSALLSQPSCVTGTDGTCSVTMTDPVAESVDLSASVDGQNVSGSPAPVVFQEQASESEQYYLMADATVGQALADGQQAASITATVVDTNLDPVSGMASRLVATTDPAVTLGQWVEDNDSTYTLSMTSTVAGSYSVKVDLMSKDGTTVLLTSGADVTFKTDTTPTNGPSATTTPSQTPTATTTPGQSPTATDSPAATNTPAESPSVTNTPAESPSVTNTPAESPSVTNTPAESPSVTNTPAESPSVTNTPAESPTVTNTSDQPAPTPTVSSPTAGTSTTAAQPSTSTAAPSSNPTLTTPLYSVTVDGSGSVAVGNSATVMFSALTGTAQPIGGVKVDFTISQPGSLSDTSCVTDDVMGICKVTITSDQAGDMLLHALVNGVEVAGTNGMYASPVAVSFIPAPAGPGATASTSSTSTPSSTSTASSTASSTTTGSVQTPGATSTATGTSPGQSIPTGTATSGNTSQPTSGTTSTPGGNMPNASTSPVPTSTGSQPGSTPPADSGTPIYAVAAGVNGQVAGGDPNVVIFSAVTSVGVPISSVKADFSLVGGATLSTTSCVTGADGTCQVTVSSTAPGSVQVRVFVNGTEVAGYAGQGSSPVTVVFTGTPGSSVTTPPASVVTTPTPTTPSSTTSSNGPVQTPANTPTAPTMPSTSGNTTGTPTGGTGLNPEAPLPSEAATIHPMVPGGPAVTMGEPVVVTGSTITLSGQHWAPFETVTITIGSTPVTLPPVQADATGSISGISFPVPADFETGTHTLTAVGSVSGTFVTTFTVEEPSSGGQVTAPTGGSASHASYSLVAILVMACFVGVIVVAGLRRRASKVSG